MKNNIMIWSASLALIIATATVAGVDLQDNNRWLAVDFNSDRVFRYKKKSADIEMMVVRWRGGFDGSWPAFEVHSEIANERSLLFSLSDVQGLIDDPSIIIPMNQKDADIEIEFQRWPGTIELLVRSNSNRPMIENSETLLLWKPDTYSIGLPHEEILGFDVQLCGDLSGQLILSKLDQNNRKAQETLITPGHHSSSIIDKGTENRVNFIKKKPGLTMLTVTASDEKTQSNGSGTSIEIHSGSADHYALLIKSGVDAKNLEVKMVGGNQFESLDFRRKCGFDPLILDYALANTEDEKKHILEKGIWQSSKKGGSPIQRANEDYSTKSLELLKLKSGNYEISNGFLYEKGSSQPEGKFVGSFMAKMRYFYLKVLDSSDKSHQPIITVSKVMDSWEHDEGLARIKRMVYNEATLNRVISFLALSLVFTCLLLLCKKSCCQQSKGEPSIRLPSHRKTEFETVHTDDQDDEPDDN